MKKSFGKFMFVSIILSLAVFSAAFGVYAIISSQMDISLSVGYTSYNCKANVSGVITGASLDGNSLPVDIPLSSVSVTGKNNQTQSLSLGTFYFTDHGTKNVAGRPHPIKIWFTIQNTSEFPICVDVSLPTITDVEVVADKTSHVIQVGKSDQIMVTFTLTNLQTSALDKLISSNGLNFTFKKFLKTKQDIVVHKDSTVTLFENHPYYIEFGNYYGTGALKWLVGGTVDANGQTHALTDADKTQLNTGKFAANKNYYLICVRSLYGSTGKNRILVQNNCYYGDSWSNNCYLLEYPNIVDVADYSLSTIRQYLAGHTVKCEVEKDKTACTLTPSNSAESSTHFKQLYNLEDYIYALIQKRSMTQIYQTLGYENTPLPFPTSKADNLTENEADAFWIPTEADVSVLGEDNLAVGSSAAWVTFTKMSSSGGVQKLTYHPIDGASKTFYLSNETYYSFRPAFII